MECIELAVELRRWAYLLALDPGLTSQYVCQTSFAAGPTLGKDSPLQEATEEMQGCPLSCAVSQSKP